MMQLNTSLALVTITEAIDFQVFFLVSLFQEPAEQRCNLRPVAVS